MRKFHMSLTLFGADGSGAAAGAGVSGVAAGTEAGAEAPEQTDATSAEQGTGRPSFKDLIKGEYKQEADDYIQGIVRSRVRDSKRDKETISAQNEILEIVASKYGMDMSDLAALKEKVSNDDAYYEERAMEEGLTVDQYKRIAQAEAKNRKYEAQYEAAQRDAAARQQVAEWQQQAEQVKQSFPSFDLQAELQNPTFQKLLKLGVNVKDAYVSMHTDEILQGAMSYTAAEVRKATANDIAARGSRPREAASSARASATVRTDVSKLTKADREALSRRALSGETVVLG